MLYLNRKPGEAVIINHCIEVRAVRRPSALDRG